MEAVLDRQPAKFVTSVPERAASGDAIRSSFEQLYRENVGRTYALCLRLSGDPRRAEELTQDVFVRAWEKLDGFRGDSAFSTWLHRLAINVVLGQRRSEGRRDARLILVEDLSLVERNGDDASVEGNRMDLERAVGSLPEGARAVFVMHEVEGYTHEEIARMTGRAEGTCKALLHRARKLLRERLER